MQKFGCKCQPQRKGKMGMGRQGRVGVLPSVLPPGCLQPLVPGSHHGGFPILRAGAALSCLITKQPSVLTDELPPSAQPDEPDPPTRHPLLEAVVQGPCWALGQEGYGSVVWEPR